MYPYVREHTSSLPPNNLPQTETVYQSVVDWTLLLLDLLVNASMVSNTSTKSFEILHGSTRGRVELRGPR